MTEEKVTMEQKMAEAICRMNALGINSSAINNFKECDMVPVFITGIKETELCVLPKGNELIFEFEDNHNALVYAVVFTDTPFGTLESLLYVSDDEDEWETDRWDIEEGYAMTWTENLTYPSCSEFGSIAVSVTDEGALKREG